ADFDAVALGAFARELVGANIEANHGSTAGMGQDDVALGDTADARLQNLHADLVGRKFVERALDRFRRSLHIGLEHDRKQALLAALARLEQLVESLARTRRLTLLPAFAGAIFGDLARTRVGLDDNEFVAGFRRARESEDLHGCRRPRTRNRFAAIV